MLSLLATSARALLVWSVAGAPIGMPVTPGVVAAAAGEMQHFSPFPSLSEAELSRLIREDLGSLGSMAIGRPNRGQLLGGVPLRESKLFHVVAPGAAYGTEETIYYLTRATEAVHAKFPDTAPLAVGDISREGGGPLRPHHSHQCGRDVDVGFYYSGKDRWYRRGTANNLDLARNWAFVRALITETDLEVIFLASYIQKLLYDYALKAGEDPAWLKAVFHGNGPRQPLLRHAPGHATHFHVRFYNPFAERAGLLAEGPLVDAGKIQAFPRVVVHKAKKGETLGMIAKKYGTTVRAIQVENRLRGTKIQARVVYRIPLPPAKNAPVGTGRGTARHVPTRQVPSPP